MDSKLLFYPSNSLKTDEIHFLDTIFSPTIEYITDGYQYIKDPKYFEQELENSSLETEVSLTVSKKDSKYKFNITLTLLKYRLIYSLTRV